jgi:hypothetical protein
MTHFDLLITQWCNTCPPKARHNSIHSQPGSGFITPKAHKSSQTQTVRFLMANDQLVEKQNADRINSDKISEPQRNGHSHMRLIRTEGPTKGSH